MAKFTKLNIGDVVASSGGKVLKKLSAESATEDSIVGTWYFNDSINLDSFPAFVVEFTNNGIDYVSMSVYDKDSATGNRHKYFYYHNADIETTVYYSGSDTWYDETYRTIAITSEPTDSTFIEWLKANATKQGAKPLITFTIAGTSYQAEEGMTWYEWCNSNYNTYGYGTGNESGVYVSKNIGGPSEYICKSASGGFSNCVVGNGVIEANATYYHYVSNGDPGN